MKSESIASWQESYTNLDSVLKSRDISLPIKVHISQGYGLPSAHIQLWEMDHKEGRAPKNWCFWIVVLEKTPESPLDSKEIKPVNLIGNQLWIFIGRTDAEAPILWPPDASSSGKDPDAGKDYRRKESRVTEDEMVVTASPMQWTWTWTNSERLWGTGNPGVLQSMGSWRHNFVTEQPQHRISMLKI